MVDVRPIEDAAALDAFVRRQPLSPYLQSWSWGEFQHALGRRIWRLGAWDSETLVGAVTVIEHQLMLNKTYIYVPHGPVAERLDAATALFVAVEALGRQAGAIYIKFDPPQYTFPFTVKQMPAGATVGTTLQPMTTLVVAVDAEPATLLESMHSKTRYNIRLAEKKGVNVRWSTDDKDFERFMELQRQTFDRQGIRMHPDGYYRRMFEVLRTANMTELVIGEYNGQAESINQIIWYGSTATFLHGGSGALFRELMIPYLVQWRTIEEAHRRGMRDYDFRGIAPESEPDHKLVGVTRFKKGFGGRVVTYPPAVNLILQRQWYLAYRYAKRFRGGSDD